MAQSVKPPTPAQVIISRFTDSSPASGSVLTAQSLELDSDSVSLSLFVPPLLTFCLPLSLSPSPSLSLSKVNIKKNCLIKINKQFTREISTVLDMMRTITIRLFGPNNLVIETLRYFLGAK